jgi:hypothetical protein
LSASKKSFSPSAAPNDITHRMVTVISRSLFVSMNSTSEVTASPAHGHSFERLAAVWRENLVPQAILDVEKMDISHAGQ